jgi:REP element-mobilizing transposase RayT
VWATWDRLPLLTPGLLGPVYACILEECGKLDCECVAVGGTDDHIHVVMRIPTTVTIAALAKQLKGSTSHLVTHRIPSGEPFKWQGGYGAFTVSKNELPRIVAYVKGQVGHHQREDLVEELERVWIEVV